MGIGEGANIFINIFLDRVYILQDFFALRVRGLFFNEYIYIPIEQKKKNFFSKWGNKIRFSVGNSDGDILKLNIVHKQNT